MAVTLTHIGRTPGRPQFDLDRFIEHFKADAAADVAINDPSVPQRGDAHGDYPNMFVTDVAIQETGERASALDVTYMGCMKVDESSDPILPPVKHQSNRSVQSATTYTSSAIFPAVATVPASLQYYAPSSVVTEFSTTATSATEPDDPPDVVVGDLITWTLQAEQPAGSIPGIADWLLANAFSQAIVETRDATEVVSGQYWQITKRKTKILLPWAPS